MFCRVNQNKATEEKKHPTQRHSLNLLLHTHSTEEKERDRERSREEEPEKVDQNIFGLHFTDQSRWGLQSKLGFFSLIGVFFW